MAPRGKIFGRLSEGRLAASRRTSMPGAAAFAVSGFMLTGFVLAGFVFAGFVLAGFAMPSPAMAQSSFENPFRNMFEPAQQERPVDYSRAPAAKKSDVEPSTRIMVLGDSLSDWLAYGLEDLLSDMPEIGIIRKHRTFSGLIRYGSSAQPDMDWPKAARAAIEAEKPQAIVVMLGLQDRQAIRDKASSAKPASRRQSGASPQRAEDDAEQTPDIIAPEPQSGRDGAHDYRSERWEQLYVEKIDEMIAAVKSANVPVLWVGMPAIRGARSTEDALYLNELFRAAADRAGIMYVDIWDGFVDEDERFTTRGPDLDGQIRALRTPDGTHFTRHGARKLAHYVERDLRRVLTAPMPVALTSPGDAAIDRPSPFGPSFARPLAGPVLYLSTPPYEEELLGAAGKLPKIDLQTERVLVKGDAPLVAAGRADDFSWPRATPNAVTSERLPSNSAPIYAGKPIAKPKAVARASEEEAMPPRPQTEQPTLWRRAPPPQIRSLSDFFGGLFR